MELIEKEINVYGSRVKASLMQFSNEDRKIWKNLFDLWIGLKLGMRAYKAREPNMLEGISEVAFCLYSGSERLIKLKKGGISSSFDTYNPKTEKAEQIKAASVMPDLTSFGPRSKWDDLYFLDFFNDAKTDGTFNVYKIPNELIYNYKINSLQTFTDQQAQGRRPRLKLAELISKNNIKPIDTNVKVW